MSRSVRLLTFGWLFSVVVLACTSPMTPTQPASPALDNLLSAETIAIQNDCDWMGLAAAIEAHYTLNRGDLSYAGTGTFAVHPYATGEPLTAAVTIDIPLNVAQTFLHRLEGARLETSVFMLWPGYTDCPATIIKIVTPAQTVTFTSTSSGGDHSPWGVIIQASGRTVGYISYSPIPADALKTLNPFLKRDVLERLIAQAQQMR